MKTTETSFYLLKNNFSIELLTEKLSKNFTVEVLSPEQVQYTILDDFDHHIWHSNRLLTHSQNRGLELFENGQLICSETSTQIRFWWDLPDGQLKDILRDTIGLRALTESEFGSLHVTTTQIVLQDEETKIVARLELNTHITQRPVFAQTLTKETKHYLALKPLRGYAKEASAVLKSILPLSEENIEHIDLRHLLQHDGFSPKQNNKTVFNIKPETPAEAALRKMSVQMLELARNHEEGIYDDIDTEFLHDYRVNFRKSRSIISLLKKTLPEETYQDYKKQLSDMAGKTGALRDLDVFLLDKDNYTDLLPENYQTGINKLFNHITEERKQEHKKLSGWLKGADYKSSFKKLIDELKAPPTFTNDLAKKDVYSVVQALILKRYLKIRRTGSMIVSTTPDDDVHELRIECKKLRYLMEFFTDLFPPKKMKKLIKSLKSLQTILGNFNDYCVQKDNLFAYDKKYGKDKSLSIATNSLIAVLHQKQIQEKAKVQEAFIEFGSKQTALEFNLLFGNTSEGKA